MLDNLLTSFCEEYAIRIFDRGLYWVRTLYDIAEGGFAEGHFEGRVFQGIEEEAINRNEALEINHM